MSKVQVVTEESIYKLVSDGYGEFGRYVNLYRAIPGVDGLKPIYRRIIMAASKVNGLSKTSGLIADTMKYYSPHGDSSIGPPISRMVRNGLLRGKGNHGAELLEFIGAAAPRYTQAGSNPDLIGVTTRFAKYAPHFENELGTNEPEYLITPVPLCITALGGDFGIGVGVNTRIPAFSYDSVIEAYESGNFRKLRPAFGYKLLGGDVRGLWETGRGNLTISYDVRQEQSADDGQIVTIIEGSGKLFKPRMALLDPHLESDRIWIRNESKTGVRLVIGRTKNTRAISDEEIFELCKSISFNKRTFGIQVNVFGVVRAIGIKDWVDVTMNLYRDAFERDRTDRIEDLNRQIEIHSHIPEVAKLLMKNKSNEEISKALSLDDDIVKAIAAKPISILRKKDFDSAIQKFADKIEEIKGMKVEDSIRRASDILSSK